MSAVGRIIRIHNLQVSGAETYVNQLVSGGEYYTIQGEGERKDFADNIKVNQDMFSSPQKLAIDDGSGIDFDPAAGKDWLNLVEPDVIFTLPEGVSGGEGYFVREAKESGGSAEMKVDGSTPVDFLIEAESISGFDLHVKETRFVGRSTSIRFGGFLGSSSDLVSGIACDIDAEGDTLVEVPGTIKSTDDFFNAAAFGNDPFVLNIQTGKDTFRASMFYDPPIILRRGTSDKIKITIQDDLTTGNKVSSLKYLVFGLKRK